MSLIIHKNDNYTDDICLTGALDLLLDLLDCATMKRVIQVGTNSCAQNT